MWCNTCDAMRCDTLPSQYGSRGKPENDDNKNLNRNATAVTATNNPNPVGENE